MKYKVDGFVYTVNNNGTRYTHLQFFCLTYIHTLFRDHSHVTCRVSFPLATPSMHCRSTLLNGSSKKYLSTMLKSAQNDCELGGRDRGAVHTLPFTAWWVSAIMSGNPRETPLRVCLPSQSYRYVSWGSLSLPVGESRGMRKRLRNKRRLRREELSGTGAQSKRIYAELSSPLLTRAEEWRIGVSDPRWLQNESPDAFTLSDLWGPFVYEEPY